MFVDVSGAGAVCDRRMEPHVLRLPNAEDFAEHAEARAILNPSAAPVPQKVVLSPGELSCCFRYCQLGKEPASRPKSSSTGSSGHVFPAGLSKGNWLCGLCEVKSSGLSVLKPEEMVYQADAWRHRKVKDPKRSKTGKDRLGFDGFCKWKFESAFIFSSPAKLGPLPLRAGADVLSSSGGDTLLGILPGGQGQWCFPCSNSVTSLPPWREDGSTVPSSSCLEQDKRRAAISSRFMDLGIFRNWGPFWGLLKGCRII